MAPTSHPTTTRRSVTVKLPLPIYDALDNEQRRTGLMPSEIIRQALVALLLPESESMSSVTADQTGKTF